MRTIALSFLLTASSLCAGEIVALDSATKDGEEYEARFCASVAGSRFDFDGAGNFQLRRSEDARGVRKANLPILKNEFVDWIWIKPIQNDLLIAYEATSGGDYSRGGMCRFTGETLNRRWCSRIDGFNVVAGISTDGSVYVGSIGFLGRIDVADGKYVWRQRNLYKKDEAFNIFGLPSEAGDAIVFEATAGAGSIPDKTVSVDRRTGVIKAIDLSKRAKGSNIGLQRTRGSCASRALVPDVKYS